MAMDLTTAQISLVLPLLNRCARMEEDKLHELLTGSRCRAAWVGTEGLALGVALRIGDDDGCVGYLVRDLGKSELGVISQLMKRVGQFRGGRSSPMTLVLDGYDTEAADYFAARGFKQIDCDHLLSTVSSAVPGDLTVRLYRPEEFSIYVRVFDRAFLPLRSANDREPHNLWSACPQWAKEWFETAAARGEMASIWVDGQMAACYRLDGDIIDSVAVVPEMQGRGLGRAVINQCIDQVWRKGHPRVYLYVAETNHRARRLYEQMGFQPELISRVMVNNHKE